MFKDDYRKETDSVHVRDSLLDEIKAADALRVRSERKQADRKRQWLVAIPTTVAAAAACVALVFGIRAGRNDRATVSANAAAAPQEAYVMTASAEGDLLREPSAPSPVGSYEALGAVMRERVNTRYGGYAVSATSGLMTDAKAAPMAEEAAEEPMEMPAPADADGAYVNDSKGVGIGDTGEKRYSGTNNQVEGVDEADIVKTDGDWIYTLSRSQNKVFIVAPDGKDTKVVSSVKLKENDGKSDDWREYQEMILFGDRLYLLGTYANWGDKVNDEDRIYSFAEVYDLGDRTAPKLTETHKQQGGYQTSRLVDGTLVIVSDYRVYSYWWDETVDPIIFCPRVVTNDASEQLGPEDIYVNPNSTETGFTVVTTIDAADGKQFDSHKAVLGGCNQVYCSGTDLLIASSEWHSDQSDEQTDENGKHFVKTVSGSDTNLFRFTLLDGKVEAMASTKLAGTLLNQFSMDAYNGYYRLVVTRNEDVQIIWTDGIDTYDWTNSSDCALYVLNGSFETVGVLENLAKDERVQSVRFMGDTAYFVTFRQVDPLFAVDLTDPAHPEILSTLKIPGFSAYLHPFGEGKLLGIGFDADEEHGWTENVKLSMFDISDRANVTEAFKLSVKDANYTSVQYNHKIVFVDVESGTVAFPADSTYYVFRADDKGFTEVGKIELGEGYWYDGARGLFVEDAFYVVGEGEIVVLSFESMEKLASVKLK